MQRISPAVRRTDQDTAHMLFDNRNHIASPPPAAPMGVNLTAGRRACIETFEEIRSVFPMLIKGMVHDFEHEKLLR